MYAEAIEPLLLSEVDVAQWRRLLSCNPVLSSPYLTPDWAKLVNRFRPDARVVVFRDGGEACGFLPVQMSRGRDARPLGGPLCDYQTIISTPNARFDISLALRALNASRVDFTFALSDHTATAHTPVIADEGHVACFEHGWDDYVANRRDAGSQILKRARKKQKKFQKDCGEITFEAFVRDDDAFAQLLNWKRIQHRQTGSTDILGTAWIRYVVEAVYNETGPDFGGELFLMRVGDELAAGLFCIRAGKSLHAWFVGHNHAFDVHSPGLLLFVDTIHAAADAGYTELDLGPGDYRFKRSLANHVRHGGPGYMGGMNLASIWRGLQYGLRRGFEAAPLGPISPLPGKAMRRFDVWRTMMKSAPRKLPS